MTAANKAKAPRLELRERAGLCLLQMVPLVPPAACACCTGTAWPDRGQAVHSCRVLV